MPGLLSGAPITPEEQERNNRDRPWVIPAVLLVLTIYIYLFTHAYEAVGLPGPSELADRAGIVVEDVFDEDRNVDCSIHISYNEEYTNDDERLVLFLGIAIAFLVVYYLPLRYKQAGLVAFFLVLVLVLYGPRSTAGFAAAHLVVYLLLHPDRSGAPWLSAVPGILGYAAFSGGDFFSAHFIVVAALSGILSVGLYRFAILKMLENERAASILRTVAVQSAVITVFAGSLLEGMGAAEWKLPVGILLFFWNWERLIMYHIDFKDGHVPRNVSLTTYLSVFMSPGAVANWNWGVTIGQGYAYTVNNFLAEDKNLLARRGLKLWGIALLYIVLGDWFHSQVVYFFREHGIHVFWRVRHINEHFVQGGSLDTAQVLATTLVDLMRWTFLWGGVVHFKVGVWNVCGYKCDPYFDKPWLSTNMVTLWSRFTFHYREFLVRAFYYPAFFRFFKKNRTLRIVFATMAAACFGNLVWGHMSESVFYRGFEFINLVDMIPSWPYFVLLGLGISVSELWLLRKNRGSRKPWTLDRHIWKDVVAAYITLQFYGMIHVFFYRATDGSVWQHVQVFLIGLGVPVG